MTVFEKRNHSPFNDQLIKEKLGLERLNEFLHNTHNTLLRIPTVYSVAKDRLCLEYIHIRPATDEQMRQLGKGLAQLHRYAFKRYGLDHDNYIGLSQQKNEWSDSWGSFFVDQRLLWQVNQIQDHQVADYCYKILSKFRSPLIQYLDHHCDQPSFLHGDLWSGNVLFDEKNVWLIDPAIYQGDREVDIAMTEMFGGFSSAFYQAYDAEFPRSHAYKHKREIYNLYHYLNHYNLFGDAYLQECYLGLDAIASLAS